MHNYEIMFILNPNAAEEEVDKINSQLEGIITASGGKVSKVEQMGRRRLAYAVDQVKEGIYLLIVLAADGSVVRELERRLRVMDVVIRYVTVRMDEDMKRLDKIKAHRQKRAERRGRAHASGEAGAERRGHASMEQLAEE
jgi:small subunit ribosomal protein S6